MRETHEKRAPEDAADLCASGQDRRTFKSLPMSLPGLKRFLMVGQWVMPGGGLPSGLMTARSAIQAICKRDRVRFEERFTLPGNLK
jgi:hypothetical protein